MRHASLFTGLGAWDLAARWMGWENLFQCEIDPFCLTVLKHHFPDAERYSDIRNTDFTPWRDKIDVLSGSFPCQAFSQAGKRKGTSDPTTATCGQKCLEQFVKSDRAGSWQKTFSALLIGMEGWFSNRCILTWKMKVTPYKRSYFQLAVSMRRTNDTAPGLLPTVTTTNSSQGFHSRNKFGLPLLPMAALLQTPTVTEIECRSQEALQRRKEMRNRSGRKTVPPGNLAEQIHSVMNGGTLTDMSAIIREDTQESGISEKLLPTPMAGNARCGTSKGVGCGGRIDRKIAQGRTIELHDMATLALLPTPTAFDRKTCHQEVTGKTITRDSGVTFTAGLRMMAPNGLLPTPQVRDWKGKSIAESKRERGLTTTFGKSLPDVVSGMLPTPHSSLHKTTGLTPQAWEKRIADKRQEDLNMAIYRKTGSTSQLSPQFVEEMMGFPRFYTVLPFLAGEKNPSKPTETP